jgi:hypothetical protein
MAVLPTRSVGNPVCHRRRLAFGLATVFGAAGAASSIEAQTQLAEASPFSVSGQAGAVPRSPDAGLELRGVMGTADGTQFCIYDTVLKRSCWVGLNERGYPFVVSSADLVRDAVTVDTQGRRMTLALRNASTPASTDGGQASAAAAYSPSDDAGSNPGPELDPATRAANEAEARRTKAMLAELLRQKAAEPHSAQQDGALGENSRQL